MCHACFMAKQSPKPPAIRLSVWGATGDLHSPRRFLTDAQYAEIRRKRADLDAKLKQMTAAERGRRRAETLRDREEAADVNSQRRRLLLAVRLGG
jgi:hypothetical protein